MYIKIVLLLIVLLQLTVCAISYIQSKRQNKKYLQTLKVRPLQNEVWRSQTSERRGSQSLLFLWGIAICINMLCLVFLTSILKYDLGADERLQNQNTIVAILILFLLEIAYIFFQYIKKRKWMDYLRYFVYISVVVDLVIRFLIMDHSFNCSFVIVIFEVNVVPIVADVFQSASQSIQKFVDSRR